MVQQVSYEYENKNYLINKILTLTGLKRTLALLSSTKIPFYREIIGSKIIKSQNMSMTLCCQKVTKRGWICGIPPWLIENSAFAIFTRYENFALTNWYHKATAPISTVLFTLSLIIRCSVMELIQNRDNQIQQAKSFYKWAVTCLNCTALTA